MSQSPSKNTEGKRTRITWDEETIARHDMDRGTRMKIDEPNTPYHTYEPSEELDEDSTTGMPPLSLEPKSPIKEKSESDLMDQWDELQGKLEKEKADREDMGEWCLEKDSPTSRKLSDKEFKQKRKQHYNEFEALRSWRKNHPNEEDDDEEAEEEEENMSKEEEGDYETKG